ncbi:hypothetical protein FVB21_21440 [Escherichia coli]|nr:hypothetical protein [Escherichia coli]
MPDGRRRKNLSATKSGHMQRRFYSQAQCHIWYNQCRIGQTPQNDVSDAIPQRLPGDLQSVLVGEFYEKSSIQD